MKYENVVIGLLVITAVSGHVVTKFAPRAGAAVAATTYVAAGVVSALGFLREIKDW